MFKKNIRLEEVEWIPSSTVDPVGRVFLWRGKLYRAIRQEATPFFQDLLDKKILEKIEEKTDLIETRKTQFFLSGFGMVAEHKKITFPMYPYEWCSEMFRDVALSICDLSQELASNRLELKDIHPYNIMFENTRPKFLDLGSIIPFKKKRRWKIAFDFYLEMVYPLYCLDGSHNNEVRHLLKHELKSDILRKKILRLLPWRERLLKILFKKPSLLLPRNKIIELFKEEIEKIKLKSAKTEWSHYATGSKKYFLPFQPSSLWLQKQKNTYTILKRLKPKTVLDMGCNIGWYSELAARLGSKVIAIDVDEASITTLYKRAKSQNLPIQTALVDFMTGTASNITWSAASERFRSDLVLALALTHHLVFSDYLYFDTIAKELSNYSKKWLVVEYIPPNDSYIKNWITKQHDWYTLDNFLLAFKRFFPKVEIVESAPYPRKLVFCER